MQAPPAASTETNSAPLRRPGATIVDVTSKGPLFKKVWTDQYAGILEYRPQHKATAVDASATRSSRLRGSVAVTFSTCPGAIAASALRANTTGSGQFSLRHEISRSSCCPARSRPATHTVSPYA